MKRLFLAAIMIILPSAAWGQSARPEADALFTKGRFDAAFAAYAQAPAGDARALRRQGQIRLFENKWAEAEALLQRALAVAPDDKAVAAAMGELESRRGRFALAAQWFAKGGRTDSASAHALFGADEPYRHALKPRETAKIAFAQTDPLPAILATVNGREGLFILDTGAGPVVLDPDFAEAAKVDIAGPAASGVFAGGKTAEIKSARISSLSLSGTDIANVPAVLVPTKAFSDVTGGKPVAGVIGTGLFSRFLTTLDYSRGQLVLQTPETTTPRGALARIPFYQVGTHYLLAEGQLNAGEPEMHFIDTGLAGFAFTAPESSLRAAHIALPALSADKGGIGQSAVGEFRIASLRLGPHIRDNLKGLYGPFPPQLEQGLGVRIGGLVSHGYFRPYAVTFDFRHMIVELR